MKIVILGGGISGLSAAWVLKQKYPNAEITLLEKSDRLGGVIQTIKTDEFLFERGPRTFQTAKCPHLLQLIREVGLESELIFSSDKASSRYICQAGKLRSIGSFLPMLLYALIKESLIPPSEAEDESIYDFAARRFSSKIAETFFDPMTLGIYGGDIRKLSIRSCFPQIFRWEREKGSCFRGAISSLFKKKTKGLFTLKRGMESLIERLAQSLDINIILSTEIKAMDFDADLIFSALPGSVIASLTNISFEPFETSLWVANLCYRENVLSHKGYGYLVPSQEKEDLLGVIWDSSIFPELNGPNKTCLTAMMRNGDIEKLKKTLSAHLSIHSEPTLISSYQAQRAIPQFEVGYANRLSHFRQEIQKKFPNLVLLGNYLHSPSVESCVTNSFNLK